MSHDETLSLDDAKHHDKSSSRGMDHYFHVSLKPVLLCMLSDSKPYYMDEWMLKWNISDMNNANHLE